MSEDFFKKTKQPLTFVVHNPEDGAKPFIVHNPENWGCVKDQVQEWTYNTEWTSKGDIYMAFKISSYPSLRKKNNSSLIQHQAYIQLTCVSGFLYRRFVYFIQLTIQEK